MGRANTRQWDGRGRKPKKNAGQAAEARSSRPVPKKAPPPKPPPFLQPRAGVPASGYVYLQCYNALSSKEIGFINVPSHADWGVIATLVRKKMPEYLASPPVKVVNEPSMRACDMEGVPLVRRHDMG